MVPDEERSKLRTASFERRPSTDPPLQPFVQPKDFLVSLHSDNRLIQGPELRRVAELRDPDEITLSAYSRKATGDLSLLLFNRFCWGTGKNEALLLRRYLNEASWETDFGSGVSNLLGRANITLKSAPQLMNGPSVALPGILPAVEFPFIAEFDPTTFKPHIFFDKFYGPISFFEKPTSEIVGDLLRNGIHDLHALYGAFRVEERCAQKSPLPTDVQARIDVSADQRIKRSWISDAEKLDAFVWENSPPGVPDRMECVPTPLAPHDGILFSVESEELVRTYGTIPEEHIISGSLIRFTPEKNRQVMVLAYVRGKDDETGAPDAYFLVNVGNRELAAREFSRHPIQSEEPKFSIEPFWYYTSSDYDPNDIPEKIEKLSNMKCLGTPIGLGSYNPNPEFAEIQTDLYLVELDASTFDDQANFPGLFQTFVNLKELRKAGAEGTVTSLPLMVGGEILSRGLNYVLRETLPFNTAVEQEEFSTRIQEGSQYRALLKENFGKQFHLLEKSETINRILEHVYNQGFRLKDDGEDFFACIPEYGLVEKLPPLKRFVLLIHDWFHGEQGDLIPWKFSRSGYNILDLESYSKGILTNEANAVWFSDVFLAEKYGFENWRAETDEFSLGEILETCGMTGEDAQRDACMSLVRDGIIPDAIRHSNEYKTEAKFRSTVHYYLGYHLRDSINCLKTHEFWQMHKETGRAILDFNPRCSSSIETHIENVKSTLTRLGSARHRGINPLKNDANDLLTASLLKLASRIGCMLDEFGEDPTMSSYLNTEQRELYSIKSQLEKTLAHIRGVHPSERNVRAMRMIDLCKERIEAVQERCTKIVEALNLAEDKTAALTEGVPLCKVPFELNQKVGEALELMLEVHEDQEDRVEGLPYTAHPMDVTVRLIRSFGISDPEMICAALLHDVVEDQAAKFRAKFPNPDPNISDQVYALRYIEEKFGKRVRDLVEALTSPDFDSMLDERGITRSSPNFREEKNKLYLEHVEKLFETNPDAFIIKLCDFLGNAKQVSKLEDVRKKEKLLAKYGPVLDSLITRIPTLADETHPLFPLRERFATILRTLFLRDYREHLDAPDSSSERSRYV